MPYRLDATELLVAEIVALRAATKRLIVELALSTPDPSAFLADQFNKASGDLDAYFNATNNESRGEALVIHARDILEEIYTVTLQIG